MAWKNPFKPKPKPVPVVRGGESPRATPYTGPDRSGESYGSPITSTPSGDAATIVSRSGGGSSGRSSGRGSSSSNNAAQQQAQQNQLAEQKALADKQFAQAEAQRQAIQQNREFIKYQTSQSQPNIPIGALKETKTATGTLNLPEKGIMPSYEKRVGDKKFTTYTPVQGTLTYDSMGRPSGPYKVETASAIERDYESQINRGIPLDVAGRGQRLQAEVISSNIALDVEKKYQGKVNKGELTAEEAQVAAQEEYITRSTKELDKVYSQQQNADIYKTQKQKRKETAINIGKGIASTNPLGATVLGAQALEKNAVVVLEKDGSIPLYPTLKQSSPEAALYLGAAAVQGIGLPFKFARQYDKATIEALNLKPLKIVGTEQVKADKSIIKIVGERGVSGAKQTVTAELPAYSLDGGKFSVQGGTAGIKTELTPFMNKIQNVKNPEVVSFDQVKVFGRGKTLPTELRINKKLVEIPQLTSKGEYGIIKGGPQIESVKFGKDITIKGKIVPETVTKGKFGGLSSTADDVTLVASGKQKALRIYPSQGRASTTFDLGQYGYIKRLPDVTDDLGSIGFKATKTSGVDKSLVQEASKQLKVTDTGKGAASLGQEVIKSVAEVKSPSTITGFRSGVVLSNQPKNGRVEAKQINIQLQAPKIETSYASLISPASRSVSRSRSRQQQIPLIRTTQLPKISQAEKQGVAQISKQVSKQQQSLRSANFFTPFNATPRIPIRGSPAPAIPVPFKLPKAPSFKQPKGLYAVEVRRSGQFRNIGTTRSLNQALSLGQSKVGGTLAASYRIKGLSAKGLKLSVPKNFYAKTDKKEGLIFIEKRSKRLSTGSEVSEIMGYKGSTRLKKRAVRGSKQAKKKKTRSKN